MHYYETKTVMISWVDGCMNSFSEVDISWKTIAEVFRNRLKTNRPFCRYPILEINKRMNKYYGTVKVWHTVKECFLSEERKLIIPKSRAISA
jgi:hypothetical protein